MDVNAAALAAELARCRCSHSYGGSSYGDWLLVNWLWHEIRWWSIPVYLAVLAALAMLRVALGGGSDC